jgi:hypothetical protein
LAGPADSRPTRAGPGRQGRGHISQVSRQRLVLHCLVLRPS